MRTNIYFDGKIERSYWVEDMKELHTTVKKYRETYPDRKVTLDIDLYAFTIKIDKEP